MESLIDFFHGITLFRPLCLTPATASQSKSLYSDLNMTQLADIEKEDNALMKFDPHPKEITNNDCANSIRDIIKIQFPTIYVAP